jgi:hypothetical protein
VLALLLVQILYKVATPFLVGTASNPVVRLKTWLLPRYTLPLASCSSFLFKQHVLDHVFTVLLA